MLEEVQKTTPRTYSRQTFFMDLLYNSFLNEWLKQKLRLVLTMYKKKKPHLPNAVSKHFS